MIRAIIFDFDGVILDSVDIKTKAFARLFEEHGPAVTQQVVEYHLTHCGVSRFRKFAYIYENILHLPMPDGHSERLGEQFSTLVFDEVVKAAWIPGALDFIKTYYKRYRLFIASGTPETELLRIVQLRQLGKYFTAVFGSPATKDQIAERIFLQYGLQRSEAVFVGDAMTDYEAARHCKMAFVAIQPGAEATFPTGTEIIPDLYNLAEIINRLQET